jgi:hexosaminidase
MQEKGFTTAHQLQAYFTARIDSFITANGRKMMGWDEILGAAISSSSVSMSWHGESKAREAAAKGNATVMAPYRYTYFDFYQSDPGLEPDITYARLQLDSVYRFNPLPEAFTAGQSGCILGGEACLWTENVPDWPRVEYMLLPRLLALSEVLWSPAARQDYAWFVRKTERQLKRFDAAGIHYAKSMYNVNMQPVFDSASKAVRVKLADQTYRYTIHYTLDGTAPTARSPVYKAPLMINKSAVLKAASFNSARQLGKINTDTFLIHKATGLPVATEPGNDGQSRLLDGITGTVEPYDGRWVMITDSITTITIDLQQQQPLQSLTIRFMEDQVGKIHLPAAVSVSVADEGKSYRTIKTIRDSTLVRQPLRHVEKYVFPLSQPTRFLKVAIHNTAAKNIILLDELAVE